MNAKEKMKSVITQSCIMEILEIDEKSGGDGLTEEEIFDTISTLTNMEIYMCVQKWRPVLFDEYMNPIDIDGNVRSWEEVFDDSEETDPEEIVEEFKNFLKILHLMISTRRKNDGK